jgi:hypothetical protein
MLCTTTESQFIVGTFTNDFEITGSDTFHRRLITCGPPPGQITSRDECFRRWLDVWSGGEQNARLRLHIVCRTSRVTLSTVGCWFDARHMKKASEITSFHRQCQDWWALHHKIWRWRLCSTVGSSYGPPVEITIIEDVFPPFHANGDKKVLPPFCLNTEYHNLQSGKKT